MSTSAIVPASSTEIAIPRYDDMVKAIAACHRVDEAQDIRDKAEALRAYAKQANNRDAEVQFAEIKVRAEIKCGEILQDMAESGGRKVRGDPTSQDATSLTALGLSRSDSSRYQQAATAQAEAPKQVAAAFAGARETGTPVTSAQIRNLTRQPTHTPAQRAEHERLWRVLRALEQIAGQDITPEQWIAALPDYMAKQVTDHLAQARPWLERLFSHWDDITRPPDGRVAAP